MLLSLLLLAGCDGKYAKMSDDEIRAIAQTLPLAERYNFYLEVRRNSRLPPNDVVVYDILALGDPAWRYTIARASRNLDELDEALEVLGHFGRYCTRGELRSLRNAAKKWINDGTAEQKERLSSIDDVCGLSSPLYGPSPDPKHISELGLPRP